MADIKEMYYFTHKLHKNYQNNQNTGVLLD